MIHYVCLFAPQVSFSRHACPSFSSRVSFLFFAASGPRRTSLNDPSNPLYFPPFLLALPPSYIFFLVPMRTALNLVFLQVVMEIGFVPRYSAHHPLTFPRTTPSCQRAIHLLPNELFQPPLSTPPFARPQSLLVMTPSFALSPGLAFYSTRGFLFFLVSSDVTPFSQPSFPQMPPSFLGDLILALVR